MYCANCGNEVGEGGIACAVCGGAVAGSGAAGHVSYEYVRTTVARDLAQVATDCYENLGFELTGTRSEATKAAATLSFRRSRKIKNKAQLVKLQRTMDDLIAGIASMESEKTRKGSMQAMSMGVASALVLGVGMCCTMVWTGLMVPGIVIGLAGIAGCIGAFFLYRRTCAKEAARINPRIEAAYDSLATACEEAQSVLGAQAV